MTDLGTVGPSARSTAFSINSASQIVGGFGACTGPFNESAFCVEKGKPMVDLN